MKIISKAGLIGFGVVALTGSAILTSTFGASMNQACDNLHDNANIAAARDAFEQVMRDHGMRGYMELTLSDVSGNPEWTSPIGRGVSGCKRVYGVEP